jgi:hypothetical protein
MGNKEVEMPKIIIPETIIEEIVELGIMTQVVVMSITGEIMITEIIEGGMITKEMVIAG